MDEKKVTGSTTCAVLKRTMHGIEDLPDKNRKVSEAGVTMPEGQVIDLFKDHPDINMKVVKTTLDSNGLLGVYSPTKIFNKLQYQCERNQVNVEPPSEKETKTEIMPCTNWIGLHREKANQQC